MIENIESRARMNEIMAEDGPTAMIDFWSETCGPCKTMAPHYDAVAETFGEEVSFFKVNTSKHPGLAASFKIRSVPTIMMIHEGEIMDGLVGSRDTAALSKKVKWLISKAKGESFLERLFKS